MASQTLQIPIDKFGRVVLPKEIRDRLGIREGMEFEVQETEEAILLKPIFPKAKIVDKNGWLVIETEGPLEEDINETIERVRRERMEYILKGS